MPPDTRERIIQAAAAIFATRGYAGATTQAIADAAGVNEVTLFRHFGSKQNLFMAVLERHSVLPDLEAALADRLTGDLRGDLLLIGRRFLEALAQRREAILMSLCEADQRPEVREVGGQMLHQMRGALAGYLRGQVEAGGLRDRDPEMMAQAFMGMFFAYTISRVMLGEEGMPPEEVVALFVEIFVDGAADGES
jgi:AcrR family transcriptional regulator